MRTALAHEDAGGCTRTTPGLDIDRCVACRMVVLAAERAPVPKRMEDPCASTLFLLWIFHSLVACGPPPVTEGGAKSILERGG